MNQCHMYLTAERDWARGFSDPAIFEREGKRCENEATYRLLHQGHLVSYRCDEHAGIIDEDGVMQPGRPYCDAEYRPIRLGLSAPLNA